MYINKAIIADIKIEFQSNYGNVRAICRPFADEFEKPDIVIKTEKEEAEELHRENPIEGCYDGYYEGTVAFRKLSEKLEKFDAFVFHGASFAVDDKGIIFCALSGTGKTTHMMLWQKLLGDKMTVVNGDKPIIRFINGEPYIYGTPWNGKEHLGYNGKARLNHICFIERSITNEVIPLDESEISKRLSTQMVQPTTPIGVLKNLEFIDELKKKCKMWLIRCNMDPEAASVSYNTIFKE